MFTVDTICADGKRFLVSMEETCVSSQDSNLCNRTKKEVCLARRRKWRFNSYCQGLSLLCYVNALLKEAGSFRTATFQNKRLVGRYPDATFFSKCSITNYEERKFQLKNKVASRQSTLHMSFETTVKVDEVNASTDTQMRKTPTVHSHPMPPRMPDLKNDFYLLRHGQSTANLQGIISSDRSLANSTRHGLTGFGWEQGRQSASQLLDLIEKDDSAEGNTLSKKRMIYFCSSPFARAKETAEACMEALTLNEQNKDRVRELDLEIAERITLDDGLMERYFGRLDGDYLFTYSYVWPVDMFDVTHKAFEVESVAEVSERTSEAVQRIDTAVSKKNAKQREQRGGDDIDSRSIVVLASHADTLQILQVFAAGLANVGMFSSYRFANGEVRAMKRSTTSLPKPVPLEPPKDS